MFGEGSGADFNPDCDIDQLGKSSNLSASVLHMVGVRLT